MHEEERGRRGCLVCYSKKLHFWVGNLSHSSFFSRDDFQMLFPSLFFAPLPEAEEKEEREASQQPHLFPPPPSQLISWPVSTYVRRFQLRRRWRLSSGPPYKIHTQGKKRRRRRLSQAVESVCISRRRRRRRLPSSHTGQKCTQYNSCITFRRKNSEKSVFFEKFSIESE